MYYEIVFARGGYMGRVRGANHEIVWTTEILTTKSGARNAIRLLQAFAGSAPVYDRTA